MPGCRTFATAARCAPQNPRLADRPGVDRDRSSRPTRRSSRRGRAVVRTSGRRRRAQPAGRPSAALQDGSGFETARTRNYLDLSRAQPRLHRRLRLQVSAPGADEKGQCSPGSASAPECIFGTCSTNYFDILAPVPTFARSSRARTAEQPGAGAVRRPQPQFCSGDSTATPCRRRPRRSSERQPIPR